MNEEFEVAIKSWWKSATVWLTIIYVVAMFIVEFAPQIQDALPGGTHLWLTVLQAAAIAYIRVYLTRQPLTVAAAVKPMVADQVIVRDNPPVAIKEEPLITTSWRYKKHADRTPLP